MTTLDDMLIETANYCDVDIVKTGGAYTGDSLVIVRKLTSALNYALNKIYRDKLSLEYAESITLDANLEHTLTGLTKNLLRVKGVTDAYHQDYYTEVNADKLYMPLGIEGGTYTLAYAYMPLELTLDTLTGITELPATVDMRIPCYYAAYFYLANDSDDRAATYMDLFNDGFNSINARKAVQKRVRGRAY